VGRPIRAADNCKSQIPSFFEWRQVFKEMFCHPHFDFLPLRVIRQGLDVRQQHHHARLGWTGALYQPGVLVNPLDGDGGLGRKFGRHHQPPPVIQQGRIHCGSFPRPHVLVNQKAWQSRPNDQSSLCGSLRPPRLCVYPRRLRVWPFLAYFPYFAVKNRSIRKTESTQRRKDAEVGKVNIIFLV